MSYERYQRYFDDPAFADPGAPPTATPGDPFPHAASAHPHSYARPDSFPYSYSYSYEQSAPTHQQEQPGLTGLRASYRRLRRVATFTALGYFVFFLFLSGYAPGLMSGEVSGGLTTGLLLGFLQLPVTLVAIAAYERIARHRVDPLAAAIRDRAAQAAGGARA
ncbi:DUF485 domain-containing protein [Streptomyces sp. NPDC127084]|uniref:DUF485 domain-containing protein n=1 Tax=Streptomyces sp. NPDC127084 TaxID=3347133 RepID=UPI003663CF83